MHIKLKIRKSNLILSMSYCLSAETCTLSRRCTALNEEQKVIKSWIYQRSKKPLAEKLVTQAELRKKSKRLKEIPEELRKADGDYQLRAKQDRDFHEKNKMFLGEYRYTPQCDKKVTYVADDVSAEKCEFTEDAPCHACTYGDNIFKVCVMKDGNWVFCGRWSGCMSYSSSDGENFVYVCTSEQDMIDHGMDAEQRSLYLREKADPDVDVTAVQALWWE
jgi:hypothetical protein